MHLDKRNSYNKYFAKPNKFDKKKRNLHTPCGGQKANRQWKLAVHEVALHTNTKTSNPALAVSVYKYELIIRENWHKAILIASTKQTKFYRLEMSKMKIINNYSPKWKKTPSLSPTLRWIIVSVYITQAG